MKKRFAILNHKIPAAIDGKWVTRVERFRVEVMATVGIHAMVRRPRCAPFVAHIKDLEADL